MYSWIAFVLLFIRASWAFNCNINPIYVDTHLRAVHGTDDFEYGSFIGFGSPAQNQSLWPSLTSNETTVADTNFCQNSSFQNCANSTGGFFDIQESNSWKALPNYQSKNVGNHSSNDGVFGEDTVTLYTHFFESDPAWATTFSNMPVEVIKNGSSRPDKVGLGPSSTLIQKLWDTGMISSRSFGFYLGTGFDRAKGVINGSTVFGGYDGGRFTGTVHNYTLTPNTANPFKVHVASIMLNDPSGLIRNVNLINDTGFDALITTDQYPMSFPDSVTQRFMTTLAATPSTSPDGSLRVGKPFNGTMTITLSDGFAITLAPEVVSNVSSISPVQAPSDPPSTGPFYLGGSYLSQVYLMANYDDSTFHLAQAIPEAQFIITKTMCPHVVPTPYVSPKVGFLKGGLIGAVLGGVIGGSAVLTVAVCFCLNWRHQRTRKRVRYFDGNRGGVKIHQFEVEDDEEALTDVDGKGGRSKQPWRKVGSGRST